MRHEVEFHSASRERLAEETVPPCGGANSSQHLAEFSEYDDLIRALRARAMQRRIAIGSEAAAQIAGVPDRYISKLLSPNPTRRFGLVTLGPVLGLLGVKLALIEDPEALARYDARTPKMAERNVRADTAVTLTISRRRLREIGRKGAEKTNRVLADKRERRKKWRLAKANQRATARAALAVASSTEASAPCPPNSP